MAIAAFADIAEAIAAEYAVSAEAARSDLESFLQILLETGALAQAPNVSTPG